jgi:hypothetical protein
MATLTQAFSPTTLHPELRLSHTEKEGALPFPAHTELLPSTLPSHPCSIDETRCSYAQDSTADCLDDGEWHSQQQEHAHLFQPCVTSSYVSDANAVYWPEEAFSYDTQWTSSDLMSSRYTRNDECNQDILASYCLAEHLAEQEHTIAHQWHDNVLDHCACEQSADWLTSSINASIQSPQIAWPCSPDSALTMLSLVSAAASALEQSKAAVTSVDHIQYLAGLVGWPMSSLDYEAVLPAPNELSER